MSSRESQNFWTKQIRLSIKVYKWRNWQWTKKYTIKYHDLFTTVKPRRQILYSLHHIDSSTIKDKKEWRNNYLRLLLKNKCSNVDQCARCQNFFRIQSSILCSVQQDFLIATCQSKWRTFQITVSENKIRTAPGSLGAHQSVDIVLTSVVNDNISFKTFLIPIKFIGRVEDWLRPFSK